MMARPTLSPVDKPSVGLHMGTMIPSLHLTTSPVHVWFNELVAWEDWTKSEACRNVVRAKNVRMDEGLMLAILLTSVGEEPTK